MRNPRLRRVTLVPREPETKDDSTSFTHREDPLTSFLPFSLLSPTTTHGGGGTSRYRGRVPERSRRGRDRKEGWEENRIPSTVKTPEAVGTP